MGIFDFMTEKLSKDNDLQIAKNDLIEQVCNSEYISEEEQQLIISKVYDSVDLDSVNSILAEFSQLQEDRYNEKRKETLKKNREKKKALQKRRDLALQRQIEKNELESKRKYGNYEKLSRFFNHFVKIVTKAIKNNEIPNIKYFEIYLNDAQKKNAALYYEMAKELKVIKESRRGGITVPVLAMTLDEFNNFANSGLLNDYLCKKENEQKEIRDITKVQASKLTWTDGYEFEIYCASLLVNRGYKADTTPKSQDYGADIIAERDNIKYAIQCKLYTGPVGVDAIQQISAGCKYYHCNLAIVISISGYTKQAEKLAKELNVVLWDAAVLKTMGADIPKELTK